MGSYRPDNRSQGRRDFGERRERPELFKTVCASCGNDCEVPFRPTGSKPVYCRNCFDKQGGSDNRRSGGSNFSRDSRGPRDSRGGRDQDRPMYDAVCSECGKRCRIPFQPRDDKPVFCSDCFEKKGGDPRTAQNRAATLPNYEERFNALNEKIDRILAILEPIVSLEAEEEVESTPVEEKAPKKKSKKAAKKEKVVEEIVTSEAE